MGTKFDQKYFQCILSEYSTNFESFLPENGIVEVSLRTIFTTRHAEIKQLDEATKRANVNKFTLGWFSRCDGNTVTTLTPKRVTRP